MLSENIKKACPECLSLLGDKTRAKIIKELKKEPKNVSKILESFSLTQPTLTHHLRVLEKKGIISSKKQGREVFYFLNKKYPCGKCNILKMLFKS